MANVSQDRARLHHQYHHLNWDQYKTQPRHQYQNWHQSQNWDQDQNQTLGIFVCVAQNPLGTVRRRLQLRLAGTGTGRGLLVLGCSYWYQGVAGTGGWYQYWEEYLVPVLGGYLELGGYWYWGGCGTSAKGVARLGTGRNWDVVGWHWEHLGVTRRV